MARRNKRTIPRSNPIDLVWMLVRDDPLGKGKQVLYSPPATNPTEAWFWQIGHNRHYMPDQYDQRKKALTSQGWRAKQVVIGEAY